jgi:MFS family permease
MSTDDPIRPGDPADERTDPVPPAPRRERRWVARLLWSIVLAALLVALIVLAAATLPQWWSERIADRVQGSTSSGIAWGLFYGFGFTLVPLLAMLLVNRRWGRRAGAAMVVLALLVATPNWLTLAVVLGTNDSALDGRAIMEADAPGFRGATLAGALVAVALVLVAAALLGSARRRRRQVHELRDQIARREAETPPDAPRHTP